ncbi:MAG: PIN domain-containing protein [Rhodomicrobium sp.]
MSANSFLDTNILIYAFSDDPAKAERAAEALAAGGSISVQVLNEFVNVCSKKLKLDWKEIEERLEVVRALVGEVAPVGIDMHEKAVALARDQGFSFYDALIAAAALALNCTELLTEDMQDGRVVMNLTIRNPFASPPELGH